MFAVYVFGDGQEFYWPGLLLDKISDVGWWYSPFALGIDRYKEMLVELLKKFWQRMVSGSAAFTREVM